MASKHIVQTEDRYIINPMFLFRWEESQNSHVLLYPEGVVKLNPTAAAVLKYCTGEHSADELIKLLVAEYNQTDPEVITQSAIKFLEASHDNGWIRIKS